MAVKVGGIISAGAGLPNETHDELSRIAPDVDYDDYVVDLCFLTYWASKPTPEYATGVGIRPRMVGRTQKRFVIELEVPPALESRAAYRAWYTEALSEAAAITRDYLPRKGKSYPAERLARELDDLRNGWELEVGRLSDLMRVAELSDPFDPDRSDLEVYAAMVDELGAKSVLDVGCGTGTFACMLANRGIHVVGVDPDLASIDVARAKPGADRVSWIVRDASSLPPLEVDAAFMTANVAQVFLTDEEWISTLTVIHRSLRPGGRLVFETRDPARAAWREWTRDNTYERVEVPGVGVVETWCDPLETVPPLISFRWTNVFESDGAVVESDTTLRFRDRAEIESGLEAAGFRIDEVRDAPDRPGREFVFLCSRLPTSRAISPGGGAPLGARP
jgi:SAM-dependent methyltransferase